MPRNRGTSRKGKPGKNERAVGLGKALQRSHGAGQRSSGGGAAKSRGHHGGGGGGMSMQPGVESIGLDQDEDRHTSTRSVLELQGIDDFLQQADLANREFHSEREGLVVLDATGQALQQQRQSSVQWADQQQKKKAGFHFKELSVPRRPKWDETTTPKELETKERETFVEWRRGIAAKEEELLRTGSAGSNGVSVTPFEKNLEVWRQLWRVMERSDCLVQLADARNPMFYLSDDLREYAASLGKPMMVLVNKSDYLTSRQRQVWYDYLVAQGWEYPVFFSAVQEQQKLDEHAQEQRRMERVATMTTELPSPANADDDDDKDDSDGDNDDAEHDSPNNDDGRGVDAGDAVQQDDVANNNGEAVQQQSCSISADDNIGIDMPLTRIQLMETMLAFARKHNCEPSPRYGARIQFGMVGFPNVGKSSVINVLVGSSKHSHGLVRAGVASQPGKTKHFQTMMLPDNDEMMLCDCPGLVFPSFVSNTADLIAAGVYPIAQMRDHWPVCSLICQRIPREIINAHYGIQLPVPTQQELRERGFTGATELPPPTAEEFLSTFCVARSMLAASSGVPDYPRAARVVIKDYAEGKLLFCHPPPPTSPSSESDDVHQVLNESEFYKETIVTALRNTKKLREKLLLSKQKESADADEEDEDVEPVQDAVAEDDDLLELLGGSPTPSSSSSAPSAKKHNNNNKKHKWGKKDRKNRNKDPYGCHSSPDDEMFYNGGPSSGVSVSAGKYSRAGYTRPTSYAGVKSVH